MKLVPAHGWRRKNSAGSMSALRRLHGGHAETTLPGMRAALGQRMHVIECRALVLQCRAAIDASAAAVSHRGELERSLVLCGEQSPNATQEASGRAGCAWESDAVTVSSGQSHLAGKDDTPRREKLP